MCPVIEGFQMQVTSLSYAELTANQAPIYVLYGGSTSTPSANLAEVNIVVVNRTLAIPMAAVRAVVGV